MLTLLLSFTGYLLPWDQLAFWAVTVGTNIAREAPIVGGTISFLLLGGNQIDQQTLLRFYVLHVFFLPVLLWILFAYHMWRVRKDGGLAAVEPIRAERTMRPKEMPTTKSYSMFGLTPGTSVQVMSSTDLEEQDLVTSSPNLTRRMMLVFLAILNATLLAAILFNAPLEEAANAAVTPNPAKAPWYFVWLQELVASTTVRLGPLTISGGFLGGIMLPGFLLIVLALWPWLDRSPRSAEGRWFPSTRRNQNGVFAGAIVVIVILIVVGVYLRGPYWKIYLPGTPRPSNAEDVLRRDGNGINNPTKRPTTDGWWRCRSFSSRWSRSHCGARRFRRGGPFRKLFVPPCKSMPGSRRPTRFKAASSRSGFPRSMSSIAASPVISVTIGEPCCPRLSVSR